jgi:hypothetical protein
MTLGKGVPSNKRNTPKGVSILVTFIVFFATFAMILSNNSLSLYHFQYVLVPKDTDKLRKKRWAVMLIGGARVYAFTHESFLGNVVNQTDPPMDVFSSTSFGNASLLSALSSELMNMESTDWRFDEQYNIQPHSHTATQPHSHTVIQPHRHTATQPHRHTATQTGS